MRGHDSEHDFGEGDAIFCPINAVLNLLSSRWTLHIIRALLDGRKRFNDLSRVQGINPRTLRERLRELEEEGVVTRTVLSEIPPHVEYALTPKGEALNGIFEALASWGTVWMRPKGPELVGETPDIRSSATASETLDSRA